MIDYLVEGLTALLLLGGAIFMLIAALGVIRMPDLLIRMHATTKAGALGGGMMVAAVAVHFDDPAVMFRAVAIVVFIFLTAPVAAHIIGRAGYFVGVPLWEGTLKDDLHGKYDTRTHQLSSKQQSDEDSGG